MDRQQFSAPGTKAVTIRIAVYDLVQLKEGFCQLCVAKQVDGRYNVIWQSARDYLQNNQFEWAPQFQIFATNMFKNGVSVRPSTNSVAIDFGEQATLDESGVLGTAKTQGPMSSVNFLNQYQYAPIYPGLSQRCTWINGAVAVAPIYVQAQHAFAQASALTPADRVLVWFDQDQGAEPGMMFSKAPSGAIEIDLTIANAATYLYENQMWTRV